MWYPQIHFWRWGSLLNLEQFSKLTIQRGNATSSESSLLPRPVREVSAGRKWGSTWWCKGRRHSSPAEGRGLQGLAWSGHCQNLSASRSSYSERSTCYLCSRCQTYLVPTSPSVNVDVTYLPSIQKGLCEIMFLAELKMGWSCRHCVLLMGCSGKCKLHHEVVWSSQ